MESTSALGKRPPFAGCLRNAGLGRSVRLHGFLPGRRAHRRQRVLEGSPRRGTPSASRPMRTHPRGASELRDLSWGRVLHSVLRPARFSSSHHSPGASRRGGAPLWYRLRKSHASGPKRSRGRGGGDARLAARRRSLRGGGPARQGKEAAAFVRRGRMTRGRVRTLCALQKSSSGVWPQISSRTRPEKGGPTRVNGGLARASGRLMSAPSSREAASEAGSCRASRHEIGGRPRVVSQAPSVGRPILAGVAVVGPGL